MRCALVGGWAGSATSSSTSFGDITVRGVDRLRFRLLSGDGRGSLVGSGLLAGVAAFFAEVALLRGDLTGGGVAGGLDSWNGSPLSASLVFEESFSMALAAALVNGIFIGR